MTVCDYFSVREDLIWGTSDPFEKSIHIVESQYLSEVYRVGIVTANSAYLIRPLFFDSTMAQDFAITPEDIRHVDDIWLNGQAAKRNIARYVVPSCCKHIDVTQTHALETYLVEHNMNRSWANTHALHWFDKYWEHNLWYRFNGVNSPVYRSWSTSIIRRLIDTIFTVKFLLSFGSM
jgi:hypothetical protein